MLLVTAKEGLDLRHNIRFAGTDKAAEATPMSFPSLMSIMKLGHIAVAREPTGGNPFLGTDKLPSIFGDVTETGLPQAYEFIRGLGRLFWVDNREFIKKRCCQFVWFRINLFKEITEAENLSFQYPEEDKA